MAFGFVNVTVVWGLRSFRKCKSAFSAAIATQEDAMASLQVRLKSREFSRAKRYQLEREILERVQLRYVALHDLRKLGK
jgi:hypothetical protein